MSTESQQLERSALEGKDRDELQTIATALGGKPTSRATKAKLVDMILELAGVGTHRRAVGRDLHLGPDVLVHRPAQKLRQGADQRAQVHRGRVEHLAA